MRTKRLALLLILPLAVACATTTQLEPGAGSDPPLPDRAAGPLFDASEAVIARHGGKAGYRMLARNDDAFHWRQVLADQAVRSIDVQTFIWHADASADLHLAHLLAAADRGVRVRVLVDEFRLDSNDSDLIALNRHPHFEVRLFNPWKRRGGAVSGVVELLVDFKRMNQRMHNKLMVADDQMAIVGGRNIGDDYFGLGERLNFVDLDLLAAGPIASEVTEAFEVYWNSPWAYRVVAKPGAEPPDDLLDTLRAELEESLEARSAHLASLRIATEEQQALLASLPETTSGGVGRVVWDSPMKQTTDEAEPVYIIDELSDLAETTEQELVVSVAYYIPQKDGVEDVRALTERGVRVLVHTNSLGANDEIVTNSGYKKYRRPLLEAGVELYELRHDAAARTDYETPPAASDFLVLHTKAFVIDRDTVFVGSLNLDPRAVYINSEMGFVVEDPVLAERMLDWFETLRAPENTWRVFLDDDDDVTWESSAGTVHRQPAKGFGERMGDFFYGLILPESQL